MEIVVSERHGYVDTGYAYSFKDVRTGAQNSDLKHIPTGRYAVRGLIRSGSSEIMHMKYS